MGPATGNVLLFPLRPSRALSGLWGWFSGLQWIEQATKPRIYSVMVLIIRLDCPSSAHWGFTCPSKGNFTTKSLGNHLVIDCWPCSGLSIAPHRDTQDEQNTSALCVQLNPMKGEGTKSIFSIHQTEFSVPSNTLGLSYFAWCSPGNKPLLPSPSPGSPEVILQQLIPTSLLRLDLPSRWSWRLPQP